MCSAQGGAVVEVFSAQGNNPVAKWKLQGAPASIKKVSSSCLSLGKYT